MKQRFLSLIVFFMLVAIPVAGQDAAGQTSESSDSEIVFVLNYTFFGVDVKFDGAMEPDINDLEPYTRFVYFLPPGQATVAFSEVGSDVNLLPDLTFDVVADTVNFVILHRLGEELAVSTVEPGAALGRTIDYDTEGPWVYFNLIETSDAVDVYYDEELVISNIGYGEVGVAFPPSELFAEEMRDSTTGEMIERFEGLFGEPNYITFDIRETEDGELFYDFYDFITTDAIDFIEQGHEAGLGDETYFTFLELLEIAGLTDFVAQADELNVMFPPDVVFEALPPEYLDSLRADPVAAENFVRHHMFEFGQLENNAANDDMAEVVTLAGTTMMFAYDAERDVDTIDGVDWLRFLLSANDGRLVNLVFIDGVLIPAGDL